MLRKKPKFCLCDVAAVEVHQITRFTYKGNEESCLPEISVLKASQRHKTFSRSVSEATPRNYVRISTSQRTHLPAIIKTNWLTLFSVNERC